MLSFVPYYIIPITNSLVLAILYYINPVLELQMESSQQFNQWTFGSSIYTWSNTVYQNVEQNWFRWFLYHVKNATNFVSGMLSQE